MQHKSLRFWNGFRVALTDRRSQAAEMVLPPGGSEGGPDNRHHGADQWLYVVVGTGAAIVAGERVPLKAGTLILIERGETHEIRNTGRGMLRTVNVYVPPAYTAGGDELPRGRP
jgi:mannose-6-phosphate isomerase-like protein (cupin superfamily)